MSLGRGNKDDNEADKDQGHSTSARALMRQGEAVYCHLPSVALNQPWQPSMTPLE